MAKTTFILEGDSAKAVSALLKVVDAQDKSTAGMRKMGRQAKATKGEMSAFKTVAGDIGKLAAGFFTAQGAIGAVREAMRLLIDEFEDLKRKQAEASQANISYAKDFIGIIGTWLGPNQIDRAHEALTQLAADLPQLDPGMGRALLGAYGAAQPSMPLERGIQAVRMAAPLTWESRTGVVKLVGELEQIMPGKPIEDIFDIAVGLRRQAGKRIEELEAGMKGVHKLLASGISPEQAMGTLMAAFESEQAGRAIGQLATLPAYFGKKVKRTFGKRLTEEDRIQLETAGMSGAEIFNWAQANPEKAKTILKTTWATVAPIMKPGAIAAGTELVRRAQAEDVYQVSLRQAQKQKLVQRVMIEEEQAAAVGWQRMGYGKGDIVGTARRMIKEQLEVMPGIGATERKMILAAAEIQGLWGGDYVTAATKGLGRVRQRFVAPTVPGPSFLPGAAPGVPVRREATEFELQQADALAGLMDRLDRLLQTSETQPAQADKQIQVLVEIRDLLEGSIILPNVNAGVLD